MNYNLKPNLGTAFGLLVGLVIPTPAFLLLHIAKTNDIQSQVLIAVATLFSATICGLIGTLLGETIKHIT